MPTIGSITKTVRINAEDLKVIEGIMADKGLSWSGAIHFLANNAGTPSKNPEKSSLSAELEDIKEMVGLFGIGFEDFTVKLCDAMNDGTIYIDEGEIKVQTDLMLDEFYEVCHEANVEPQDAINKVVQMLRR